jgi:hypothetical protein
LATKGIISPRREFFEAAFGSSFQEFLKIVYMPEEYIIYRQNHASNGAFDWQSLYKKLTKNETTTFLQIISKNKVTRDEIAKTSSLKLKRLLSHYIESY